MQTSIADALQRSLITKHGLEDIFAWLKRRREAVSVSVEQKDLADLRMWSFNGSPLALSHETGKFFTIRGIKVDTNWGSKPSWRQPIIDQPEIGILGMLCKNIGGTLHFLMQAKIEPGNINHVQISPTLQATKSNYTRVHQGKSPAYLEYFLDPNAKVLLDQLQSEQGSRFLGKRNRNIIIIVDNEVPAHDDFLWVTLAQLKQLLTEDNVINMDTRTVLSCINYSAVVAECSLPHLQGIDAKMTDFVGKPCIELVELIGWVTRMKTHFELGVSVVGLDEMEEWVVGKSSISHVEDQFFSIIGSRVEIASREVTSWDQPMVAPCQEGLMGFLLKKIDGVYHFLVQAKVECGNFDTVEIAPTVQCVPAAEAADQVPFLEEFSNPKNTVILDTYQSEEGGRFYQEQNRNMLVIAEEELGDLPLNYTWATLPQLQTLVQYNNFLNIETRSLLSAI